MVISFCLILKSVLSGFFIFKRVMSTKKKNVEREKNRVSMFKIYLNLCTIHQQCRLPEKNMRFNREVKVQKEMPGYDF